MSFGSSFHGTFSLSFGACIAEHAVRRVQALVGLLTA